MGASRRRRRAAYCQPFKASRELKTLSGKSFSNFPAQGSKPQKMDHGPMQTKNWRKGWENQKIRFRFFHRELPNCFPNLVLSSRFFPTGCPTWIKPRTFEANRAFSEGGSQGESKVGQNLARSCRAGDRVFRHQFASFASTAMDANY